MKTYFLVNYIFLKVILINFNICSMEQNNNRNKSKSLQFLTNSFRKSSISSVGNDDSKNYEDQILQEAISEKSNEKSPDGSHGESPYYYPLIKYIAIKENQNKKQVQKLIKKGRNLSLEIFKKSQSLNNSFNNNSNSSSIGFIEIKNKKQSFDISYLSQDSERSGSGDISEDTAEESQLHGHLNNIKQNFIKTIQIKTSGLQNKNNIDLKKIFN